MLELWLEYLRIVLIFSTCISVSSIRNIATFSLVKPGSPLISMRSYFPFQIVKIVLVDDNNIPTTKYLFLIGLYSKS